MVNTISGEPHRLLCGAPCTTLGWLQDFTAEDVHQMGVLIMSSSALLTLWKHASDIGTRGDRWFTWMKRGSPPGGCMKAKTGGHVTTYLQPSDAAWRRRGLWGSRSYTVDIFAKMHSCASPPKTKATTTLAKLIQSSHSAG